MRRAGVWAFVVGLLVACGASVPSVPVRPAPPSRHEALVAALAADSEGFAFGDGRWAEDQGDAAFFGVAWLAHRGDSSGRLAAAVARSVTLLGGDLGAPPAALDPSARLAGGDGGIVDKIQAALGLIELVGATGDRAPVAAIDAFLDRLDARLRATGDYIDADGSRSLRIYGPTAATALAALAFAEYALLVGGPRADERRDRAAALDDALHARAFDDLSGGGSARGFAFAPNDARLVDLPNVLMLAVEARLFRLTQKEDYRLEARALFAAIQPLKLTDAPARYATPYADLLLGVDAHDLTTLAGQSYAAWAMLLLFEITGDERFVDEADRMFDEVAVMRGPWCESQVHDGSTCAPSCAGGQSCLALRCAADRCTTGALHHVLGGRLAQPEDGLVFCSGCSFEALYVLGYRRQLAGETWSPPPDGDGGAGSCGCGGQACCAERDPTSGALVTRCLPNCITNTPRWKVCSADSDCESGQCKSYDCGAGAPALRYCDKPDGCR